MAQAQVVLTAVDRTQVAINSALKGMKTLERTAKVTSRAINLAFGLLTGSALVSAFGKINEAAKKTEEGRAALYNLNKALKDPALVSAANALVSILVNGFTSATIELTNFIKAARVELASFGLIEGGPEEKLQLLQRQLAETRGNMGMRNPAMLTKKDIEERNKILADINELKSSMLTPVVIESKKKPMSELVKRLAEQRRRELERANINTMTEIEKAVKDFEKFNQDLTTLLSAKAIKPDEASQRLKEYLDKILPEVEVKSEKIFPQIKEKTDQMSEFAKEAAKQMQQSFADFLFDPFENGLKGMLSGFLNVIRRMIAEAAAATILQSLFGGFVGSGGFLGALAGALIPAGNTRAMGGSVSAGTPYLVGERGPEMFVPGTSGNIVPNNKMGGVTVSPVYNIDARGASADLQDALPGILAENNRRIFDELDRRYGIGR